MSDTALAQAAYDAYSTSRGHKSFSGDHLPTWAQLSVEIQDGWLAAVRAIAAPTDQSVRGVQAWMAQDLHAALGLPDHSTGAQHQGHACWADWWAQLLAEVRSTTATATATSTTRPQCGERTTSGGTTVLCGRDAGHLGPWHRRGPVSWKVVFGTPNGHHRNRTTP